MGQHDKPTQGRFRVLPLIAVGLVVTLPTMLRSLPQQKQPSLQHLSTAAVANRARAIVPDVRGRTPEEAGNILASVGLRLGSTTYSKGPGAPGRVWGQNPAQHAVVWLGTSVNIAVVPQAAPSPSTHNDKEFLEAVPSLIGKTPEQARATLAQVRLKLGNVTSGQSAREDGTIFAQNPPAGRWVQVLSSVDVRIVQQTKSPPGPSQLLWSVVPPLRGQTPKDAATMLRQLGLQMGSVSTGVAQGKPGTVFGQEPQPNTKVRVGTVVNVWVVQAAPMRVVVVPNLIHLDLQRAQTVLQTRQLELGKVAREESDSFVGLVTAQSPQAGTRVQAGATVSVTVAAKRPLVTVPDVMGKDESTAASILNNAKLRMGNVVTRDSEERSGTVLSQNLMPGVQAHTATEVDVVVSHQILRTLMVMTDDPTPEIGKQTKFHAHLVPDSDGFQYRFDFGDGPPTPWLAQSTATHTYRSAGSYKVRALAMQGTAQVRSPDVEVLAREAAFNVLLEPTPRRARPRDDVTFQASVDRADILPSYQFVFEDGTTSEWSSKSSAHRRYEKWGIYHVKVRARVAEGRIVESVAQVTVGLAGALLLIAGTLSVLALGAGSVVYFGWRKFLRWVRAVPRIDAGQQRVRIASREGSGANARLRLVVPHGEQQIRWAQNDKNREGRRG